MSGSVEGLVLLTDGIVGGLDPDVDLDLGLDLGLVWNVGFAVRCWDGRWVR